MAGRCPPHECETCGDRLIHQFARGPRESSSAFGQWVFDRVGRVLDFVDLDGVAYRRSTKVLYFLEEKHGGSLSPSQRVVLPILERAVELLIADGAIDPRSSVIEVHGDWTVDERGRELETAYLIEHPTPLGAYPRVTGAELRALLEGRLFLEHLRAAS